MPPRSSRAMTMDATAGASARNAVRSLKDRMSAFQALDGKTDVDAKSVVVPVHRYPRPSSRSQLNQSFENGENGLQGTALTQPKKGVKPTPDPAVRIHAVPIPSGNSLLRLQLWPCPWPTLVVSLQFLLCVRIPSLHSQSTPRVVSSPEVCSDHCVPLRVQWP